MKLFFSKLQATGNNFVIIYGNKNINIIKYLNKEKIKSICNRYFGIGADGFIIIYNNSKLLYNFNIVYYNSDGNIATICGNGIRCAIKYVIDFILFNNTYKINYSKFICNGNYYNFYIIDNNNIGIELSVIGKIISINDMYYINTGSPHCVIFVNNINNIDVLNYGKIIRNINFFDKNGVNVNFVQICNSNKIKMRTFERGVEDETLSCGTGTVAVVAVNEYINKRYSYPTIITTNGGNLYVFPVITKYNNFINSYILCGNINHVFSGEYYI